ncbi:hypothetical protein IKW73_02870 [Candidatus Saccharibacteria bacterium]|nr:hypothetical protein [Candidatus Saccharibacteria bacterium]
MATEANKKNLIAGICAGVAAIIIVIVAVCVLNKGPVLNDDFFKSDGSKYVLTMETGNVDSSDEYTPLKTHIVYNYSGDSITGLKSYYEYSTTEAANTAYEAYKALTEEEASSFAEVKVDGKYLIITANKEDYENLSAAEVKEQIEFYDSLKDMDVEDYTEDEEEDEDIDIEEDVADEE